MNRTLTISVSDVVCAICEKSAPPRVRDDAAGARFEQPEGWRRAWVLAAEGGGEFDFAICGGCIAEISTFSLPIRAQFVSWSDGGDVSG